MQIQLFINISINISLLNVLLFGDSVANYWQIISNNEVNHIKYMKHFT